MKRHIIYIFLILIASCTPYFEGTCNPNEEAGASANSNQDDDDSGCDDDSGDDDSDNDDSENLVLHIDNSDSKSLIADDFEDNL